MIKPSEESRLYVTKAGGVLQKLRNSCHKEPKAESPVEAEKPAEAEKPTQGGRRKAPGGGGGGGMFEVNVPARGLPEVGRKCAKFESTEDHQQLLPTQEEK